MIDMKARIGKFAAGLMGLLMALLFAVPGAFPRAEGSEPVNMSGVCEYSSSKGTRGLKELLGDRDHSTYTSLASGDRVKVEWGDADVCFVYFEWTDRECVPPGLYSIELLGSDGETLETRGGERFWNCGVEVGGEVTGIRIIMEGAGQLCTLIPFAGGMPSDYHPWLPTPEKTDMLVIATHPDDDVLFMGAMVPTYGAERGLECSILYLTGRNRVRRTEALNGAWTMGLRTYPFIAGMYDISNNLQEEMEYRFTVGDAERTIVRYIRRVRPEVVVTHDTGGEYGHWQHIVTAEAAQLAVIDAADPEYDRESYEQYGAWQVKKLYLHLSRTNPISISAEVPLEAFGGKTAWEVAAEAFQCHESQLQHGMTCSNTGVFSLERFGLVFSAVGEDTGMNDMFENIDETELTNYATPSPTEAPVLSPSPEPTAEPEETPSPEPTEEPTPTPSPTPSPTEATQEEGRGVSGPIKTGLLLTLAVLVMLLTGFLLYLGRRKR